VESECGCCEAMGEGGAVPQGCGESSVVVRDLVQGLECAGMGVSGVRRVGRRCGFGWAEALG
jgi:hypothetical protein